MPRIGLLVTSVFLLASSAMAKPSHVHRTSHPQGRRVLTGRLSTIQQKKHDVRVKLHQTRSAEVGVKKVITAVDDRLNDVTVKLAETHAALGDARTHQARAAADLAQTTQQLEVARQRARARLRAIAKQGDSNVLVSFLTSKSMGEMAERKDLMERIARKDHEIFTRVRDLQRKATAQKAARDAAVRQVASLASRERAQQSDLRSVREEKRVVLQGLRKQEGDLEESLKQFEDDEREIRRLIELASRVRRPGHTPVPAFIGRFMKPVAAPITSGFGMRYHPILHRTRLHAGVDFGAPIGTPVHCAAPGEVIAATCMRGFGNVVIVDHGGGLSTVYAHLSRIGVSTGAHVAQGQYLGAVGMTGLATGPHLHWEVHVGGHPVNPLGRF